MGFERKRDGGDLEIVRDVVMVEVPRGRDARECLRLRFVEARTADGKDVAWHDLREFYKAEDGTWRPGKKGISIRGAELRPVLHALAAAAGARLVRAGPDAA